MERTSMARFQPVLGALIAIGCTLSFVPRAHAWEWFRSENGHVREGNEALAAGDAEAASSSYDRAAAELPSEPGVHLNRGLALLAQDQHGPAREAFLRATEPPAPREIRASAHYDAGLSFYREADAAAGEGDHARARDLFGQAAEQFRQSLRQVPGNRDAGWNLELALRRETQEEEQQEQEEQQQQDQEQQDQEQQDQEQQDQEQQDQEQQDQQQQDQEQQDQEQQDQEQQDQQQQDQEQQDQQQQDQEQQDSQDSDPQDSGQDGEQPQDPQQQEQPSGGDQDDREDEAQGTMERSLPPDQQRVLDALQDSEENLERARARARGQRERRRPAQDW